MLTFEQADGLVRRFTYKPGFDIHLADDWDGGENTAVLVVEGEVTDARDPEHDTVVMFRRRLHLDTMYPDMLTEAVHHACRELELHEVKEWLKFDGKYVTNPHPEEKK